MVHSADSAFSALRLFREIEKGRDLSRPSQKSVRLCSRLRDNPYVRLRCLPALGIRLLGVIIRY